jgi:hypothetical protein
MKKNAIIFFTLLLCSFVFSCKKEVRYIYDIPPVDSVHLSITNASPSIPNLLFYLNDKNVSFPDSPITFGKTVFVSYIKYPGSYFPDTLHLPFINIVPGYHKLSFGTVGNGDIAGMLNNNFEPGASYSLFLTDTIVHGKVTPVLLKDSIDNSDTTKSQIRFLNLSPDTPPLDVWAYPDAGYTGYKIFSGCAYIPNDYSSFVNGETFTKIDPGIYYFEAMLAGTKDVVLGGYLIIAPKKIITIYTKGFFAGTGVKGLDVGVIQYQPQ